MFGRAAITLGIGPHSSVLMFLPRDAMLARYMLWHCVCLTGHVRFTTHLYRFPDIAIYGLPYVIGQTIIFSSCGFYLLSFFLA